MLGHRIPRKMHYGKLPSLRTVLAELSMLCQAQEEQFLLNFYAAYGVIGFFDLMQIETEVVRN
jgi:hypothetical protein